MKLILLCISFDSIIAILALIVSIISVYFVYATLKQHRKHNINTVKPISFIAAGDYENLLYVSIENNGTGPLVIKNLVVKNKTQATTSVIDIIPDSIRNTAVFSKFTTNLSNRAILAGEELRLLEYRIDRELINQEPYSSTREAIRKVLKNVEIKLSYTDIYGETTFNETRKLDWFGRNDES